MSDTNQKFRLYTIEDVEKYFKSNPRVFISRLNSEDGGRTLFLTGMTYPYRFILQEQGFSFSTTDHRWYKNFKVGVPQEPDEAPAGAEKSHEVKPTTLELKLQKLLESFQ